MKEAFRSSTIRLDIEPSGLSSSKPRDRIFIWSRAGVSLRTAKSAARAVRDLRGAAERIEAWAKVYLR